MQTLLSRHQIADKMTASFSTGGWPATVLFSGELCREKNTYIYQIIARELLKARTENNISHEQLLHKILENDYADFYAFDDNKIKIGSEKKTEIGTVRYLLNKILPYRPRNGNLRIIYFHNANLIRDQAESALLKTLEEPRADTRFFLSVADISQMKETIVSRSVEVPIVKSIIAEKVSPDPWLRYWYLSGEQDSSSYKLLEQKDLIQQIQTDYDKLVYSHRDYLVFESLTIELLKKFSKEKNDTQLEILCFALKPLYYAIRDTILEGKFATIGPFRVSIAEQKRLVKLFTLLENVFKQAAVRYFGTMPPNVNAVVLGFLSRIMRLWPTENTSA